MPAVDEMLAELAAHPPTGATPVGQIRARARRRTRRRRALGGAAAVLVVAAAGIGVGAAVVDDGPGEDVVAEGGPTTTASPPSTASTTGPTTSSDVPVAVEPPTMTLDPAAGHEDGMVVAMALDEPATGPALVAQCAAEAEALGDGSTAVTPWCGPIVEMPAEDLRPFTLSRTVDTPEGTVDCAAAVGRCTLGVRVGGASSPDDRHAPLAFRDDLPPVVEPAVDVDGDEGTVGDGDRLLLTFTGVETGDVIGVHQCWVQDPAAGEEGRRCSAARSRAITVRDGPETQITFIAFHDVLVNRSVSGGYEPEWTACRPCVLVVEIAGRQAALAVLPMDMEPTATPIRPTVEVTPSGPVAPGATVTVRAAGLQPATTALVGWCPGTRAQGGGSPPCVLPLDPEGAGVAVGADGTVEVTDFPLPPAGTAIEGEDCSRPGACGIGLDAGDAFAVMAYAPLDLSG